jgi:hypothetical protein
VFGNAGIFPGCSSLEVVVAGFQIGAFSALCCRPM